VCRTLGSVADKDKSATIALHTKLRQVLTPGEPVEFGRLPREHGISPVALLRQIDLFGEVFRESVTVAGKPIITLLETSVLSVELRGRLIMNDL
jgi:hypothetical protein